MFDVMEMFFTPDERGKKGNKLLIWMFKLMVRRLLITELKRKEDVSKAKRHILFLCAVSPTFTVAQAATYQRQALTGRNNL